MKYQNVTTGTFLSRPNRFIAYVDVNGSVQMCHVKNTGRCKELLVSGTKVVLAESDNPERRTRFDLISVYKGDRLINMDSQVPNEVVAESLPSLDLVPGLKGIRREVGYGNSRFDILAEGDRPTFIEVKGVTLEDDGIVMFPDAPTERGVKHLRELMSAHQDGYDTIVFFLIQMDDVKYFTPNRKTHREFAEALREASEAGVRVVAYDSVVTEDSIIIGDRVTTVL